VELRPELMPPILDDAKVARLAARAAHIDGARPSQWEDDLAAFNREAGTHLVFADFQGIYGGTDHEIWVRTLLAEPAQKRVADISHEELLELIRRVATTDGKEHEVSFWMGLLEAKLPDSRISDLIFWPGEYFGDDDNTRQLSAEQILELALAAGQRDRASAAVAGGPTTMRPRPEEERRP
jgi:hypothetical protein